MTPPAPRTLAASRVSTPAFAIRDCALIAIATGVRAANLSELCDRLRHVDSASIYYHFWGGLLRPKFDDPEYRNDFAIWSRNDLHDEALSERLGILDPTQCESLETLRMALIDVVSRRLDEVGPIQANAPFHFVRSQIVVFDTGVRLKRPEDLAGILPRLSLGSVFYHFIDARRRDPEHVDDFRAWLRTHGESYVDLRQCIAGVDYYFESLADLRRELAEIVGRHVGRVPAASVEES